MINNNDPEALVCRCVPAEGVGNHERRRETLFLMPPLGLPARRTVTHSILPRRLFRVPEVLKDI